MNIFIIGNIHREPLVLPHIKHMNPIISMTPDYPYNVIGQFRCFHGHTNALRTYMTDETACVFEDDCVPIPEHDWQKTILVAGELIQRVSFEIVCLHGRGFDFKNFMPYRFQGFDWLIPKPNIAPWVLGTLVYVIGKTAAERFIDADFWLHGTNIDIFLWHGRNRFCMLDPRQFVKDKTLSETRIAENPPPFIHGHGAEGSILQNPRNTEQVIR